MTTPQTQPAAPTFALDPSTRLGHVHLTVNSLDRQIEFYTQVLGMTLHWRAGAEAALGTASEVLLRLTEDPAAQRYHHTSGMYHFAILYPSKKELARAIARVFALRYPNSPTDHGISMTTYLDDLEGNTIELYVRTLDRAVMETTNGQLAVRYADGRLGTGRDPLDVEALFAELDAGDRLDVPLPDGTQVGHVHLYTASLEASMAFYHDLLGFEEGPVIPGFRMGEVGLDEQQPHVIAFNTWKMPGIEPAPADALGMRYFTVVLPDAESLRDVVARVEASGRATEDTPAGIMVRDPSRIAVVLTDHLPSIEP